MTPQRISLGEWASTNKPDGLKEANDLLYSYRLLVCSLLDHTFIGQEGHDGAIGDFMALEHPSSVILGAILDAHGEEWEWVRQ